MWPRWSLGCSFVQPARKSGPLSSRQRAERPAGAGCAPSVVHSSPNAHQSSPSARAIPAADRRSTRYSRSPWTTWQWASPPIQPRAGRSTTGSSASVTAAGRPASTVTVARAGRWANGREAITSTSPAGTSTETSPLEGRRGRPRRAIGFPPRSRGGSQSPPAGRTETPAGTGFPPPPTVAMRRVSPGSEARQARTAASAAAARAIEGGWNRLIPGFSPGALPAGKGAAEGAADARGRPRCSSGPRTGTCPPPAHGRESREVCTP